MAEVTRPPVKKALPTMEQIQYEYLKTLEELEAYCIENETDEIPEEFMERLNINQNELEHKLYNYYMFIQTIQGQQSTLIGEAARLNNKASRLEKTVVYLKTVISLAVKKFGSDIIDKKTKMPTGNVKIQSPLINISRIGTDSVKFVDETKIPQQYHLFDFTFTNITAEEKKKLEPHIEVMRNLLKHWDENKPADKTRTKMEDKISKTLIKADLDAKKTVPGAEIETNHHLRFS